MTVALFARVPDNLGEERKFNFNVISAAPQEIIQSALEGIVPPDHIDRHMLKTLSPKSADEVELP